MAVMKFGGSSLADHQRIRDVARIIRSRARESSRIPIVVVSAMKGVTDALFEASRLAESGDTVYRDRLAALKHIHDRTAVDLTAGTALEEGLIADSEALFRELTDILHGVELVRECSPRTGDLIAGFGERLSSLLLAAHLNTLGIAATAVDAREIIRTDDNHGRAAVDFDTTNRLIQARLGDRGRLHVVTGYIASTDLGVATTLGRNGSDYSASILGAALDEDLVEIWTDVDGVLTADPRVVPEAGVIGEISFQEAMELSYFGAEVIHPYTLLPVMDRDIPVYIKNTLNPDAPGTRIARNAVRQNRAVTGIASIDDVSMITIEGGGMVGMPGVASRIFASVARSGSNVMMITQSSSEHSICLVCRTEDANRAVKSLRRDLGDALATRMIRDIGLRDGLEIVAVIGENMRGQVGLSGRLFSALGEAGINILAIAQGSTELNISLVIESRDKTVRSGPYTGRSSAEGPSMMRFVSTRDRSKTVTFTDAMLRGLAPDGGLYEPESYPDLRSFFLELTDDESFVSLASRMTARLLEPEIDFPTARNIVEDAFRFVPVLRTVTDRIRVLELFHGPSCAFKDFGASFLASAMSHLLADRDERAVILTATSGDTGSAVAQAFHSRSRIEVVILYPSGRVSPLQEKQLTTLGGNVTALEVDGSFDDCQRMVKSAFTDRHLSDLNLSSANSINLARLIPQSFYYVWAWTRMRSAGDFAFVVPSGNFGNLTAGLYAAAWGLPVRRFVAATNVNDVVPEYLATGIYRPRPSLPTSSNAMDVGAPSNFERLDRLYDGKLELFRDRVTARSVDDRKTMETIARVYGDYGYLCCPHTAVGWSVAEDYGREHPEIPLVLLSTAHPGKFVEVVREATGQSPELPPELVSLMNRNKLAVPMGRTDDELAAWLLKRFG